MLSERPPTLLIAGPFDMTGALAVAGLTAHADLRPRRMVSIIGRIVVLAHAGLPARRSPRRICRPYERSAISPRNSRRLPRRNHPIPIYRLRDPSRACAATFATVRLAAGDSRHKSRCRRTLRRTHRAHSSPTRRRSERRNLRRLRQHPPPRSSPRRSSASSPLPIFITPACFRAIDVRRSAGRFSRAVPFSRTSFGTSHDFHSPRASRSLQIVHIFGDGECPCAPRAIASCIKPLGARQGRRKIRLCPLLGPLDRARRWLAIDLRTDRLRCKWSGVRLACGVSHREFELRDFGTAGASVRRARCSGPRRLKGRL